MKLSEALDAAPTVRPLNNKCSVARLLGTIADQDGEQEAARVDAAIKDPARLASALAVVLQDNGHHISDQSLRRHRRGICSC